ncbi:MAG TPA: YciI family protein [Solirubrobacterales bacterium]
MKYLLTFVRDQDQMYAGTEEEMRQGMDAWNAFDREAIEAGVLIANQALELPETAKTVRIVEGGEPAVTDGPFTETKEQLGGFCLIDCGSFEEAIGWAKKVPLRPDSKVEVRQVKDLSPYGYVGATPEPIQTSA